MANIEIKYREGYCEMGCSEYNTQCHTQYAEDMGCSFFNEGKHEKNVVPFGDCVYAKFDYGYKGMTVKNYDMRVCDDNYNPHLNCMIVETARKSYQCEKVILNGKCVYGESEQDND